MEVQGKPDVIYQLFNTMKNVSSYIVIDRIEEKIIPVVSGETDFIIKY